MVLHRPFGFLHLVIAVFVTVLHSFLLSSPAHSQAGFPDGLPIGSYFAQVDASETQESVLPDDAEHFSNNELQSPGENAEIGDDDKVYMVPAPARSHNPAPREPIPESG